MPLAGLFGAYACPSVKPAAGAPRPRIVDVAYPDETGAHVVGIRDVHDSLCIEGDLGEGLGVEQANVACYRIRSGGPGPDQPTTSGSTRAGRGPLARVPGHGSDALELVANDHFGVSRVVLGQPREI